MFSKSLPVKQEKTWFNSYILYSFGCSNICNLKERITSKWYNVFSMVGENLILLANKNQNTVNSQFKKDLNLQIHLHKAFFVDDRFLDSYHKSFSNQTTLNFRMEKWSFLNREFTWFMVNLTKNNLYVLCIYEHSFWNSLNSKTIQFYYPTCCA